MSVNKVILIGNVGKDPEVRYLDTGIAVASFPLATTDRAYTLSNGTQVPERTEWHNLVLWRGLAETAEKYVHKGDKLYVEGKIRTRSYDDQNGAKALCYGDLCGLIWKCSLRKVPGSGSYAPAQQQAAAPVRPQSQQPQQPVSSQGNSADDLHVLTANGCKSQS